MNELYITLSLNEKHSTLLTDDAGDLSDFVYETTGTIDLVESEQTIGHVRTVYMDGLRAWTRDLHPATVADAHSDDLYAVHEAIFGPTDRFAPTTDIFEPRDEVAVLIAGGSTIPVNIFLIDEVQLAPAYRGFGIGAQVIKYLMQRVGRDTEGVCAINPFPLQLRNLDDPRYEGLVQDEDQAYASLRNYYARLGFMPMSGYSTMLWPLWKNPTQFGAPDKLPTCQ